MSEHNPTAPPVPVKPAKSYPEFPLTPHPADYWCKRIRGTLHYFGPRWKPSDPAAAAAAADAAFDEYLEKKEALYSGRKPLIGMAGGR